ncbi:uncharacterized protein DDB_G0283357-like [Uranotaenia lowii]|uniref:uncharacterized protein DDB_G0283357-like n=1 Tax=Uranotaenia lowii TaxID=190385 RepID=UPI00247AFD34|nr:uncharacterized protein DDB_G0283357-like [Uranotaenia lowii]
MGIMEIRDDCDGMGDRHIPSTTLAVLRGILVKSLSRENLSLSDQQLLAGRKSDRHVSFHDAGNRDANVQKQTRPSSANRAKPRPHSVGHTLHWFACVGGDEDFDTSSSKSTAGNSNNVNSNNNYSNQAAGSQVDANEDWTAVRNHTAQYTPSVNIRQDIPGRTTTYGSGKYRELRFLGSSNSYRITTRGQGNFRHNAGGRQRAKRHHRSLENWAKFTRSHVVPRQRSPGQRSVQQQQQQQQQQR